MIYLWVNDELHVDKFNDKDARLYQVMKVGADGSGTKQVEKYTQGLLAGSMADEIPEVENAVAVRPDNNPSVLTYGEKHVKIKHEFAGKDFFQVFSYPLVDGNNNKVSGVKGVFLSDRLALKLFNTTAVTGKTVEWDYKDIEINYSGSYSIAGVYKSPPSSATSQFDMLVPFDLYAAKNVGGMGDITFWGSNMAFTYVALKKGADPVAFNNKIKDFSIAKIKALYPGKDLEKYEGSLFARRYSDGYLYNNYVNGEQSGGRIDYVRLFSIIALFILVIACINFMNLSTAKAAGRMKDVGIRKVVGAPKGLLVVQYLAESLLITFLSVTVAVLVVWLLLPAFKEITGKELSIQFSADFIITVLSIALATGMLAGSYPAFYLSAFKPAMVLKGKSGNSPGESFIRKGLVVFQFAISAVLIIAVIIVYKQMQLVQTKDLGYNKDNIIRFPIEGKLRDNSGAFLEEARNLPGVMAASTMQGDFLGHAGHSGGGISWDGKDPNLRIEYFGVSGDYDFMKVLGLKMAEGRSFSKTYGSDSASVIFNQSAIAAMGIKNPVGKVVSLWGVKKEIIGVVKDFNFESLYKKVGPAFLEYSTDNETVLVKISSGMESQATEALEKLFKTFNPGLPLEYKFLDEDYQAMYSSEQRVAVLSKYFAGIAILISCLGLFGLAAFTVQRRQKEIGIRKVIGASVNNIMVMLSKDFLELVLIAVFIAFPIAWWALDDWLKSFAYRVNIGAVVFLIAGGAIIVIALVTVSFQAIKAAIANPVKSLRAD